MAFCILGVQERGIAAQRCYSRCGWDWRAVFCWYYSGKRSALTKLSRVSSNYSIRITISVCSASFSNKKPAVLTVCLQPFAALIESRQSNDYLLRSQDIRRFYTLFFLSLRGSYGS